MTIGQMKVTARLGAGFGLVLALLLVVAAIGVLRLSQLNRDVETFASVRTAQLIESANLLENVSRSAMQLRNLLLYDDQKQVKAEIAAVRAASEANRAILEKMRGQVTPGRQQELFQAVLTTRTAYAPQEEELLKVADSGDHASAKDLMLGRVLQSQVRFIGAIKQFSDHVVEETRRDAQAANENYVSGRALILGLAVLALLAGGAAAFFIARSIVSQLGGEPAYAMSVANSIADGDLATPVKVRPGDRTSLLFAMHSMQANLATIVGSVRSAAQSVATAAGDLASATRELAHRSEEQATNLQETAASMEELSTTVKGNTGSAKQANELARNASANAESGGKAVRQVVATMDQITASSKRIGDIISVIDGIAFQTNILALNAAVEAARAGEQGRGFAVVASEVRSLAQRSAEAAREIKQLIGGSVGQVELGARQVNDAGTTIERLVADVKRVSDLMSEIADASVEQGQGIEQVNKTVSQVEAVVAQNASVVEKSASAADSMRLHASRLVDVVGRFRLAEERAGTEAPPRASSDRPAPAGRALTAATAEPAATGAGNPLRNSPARTRPDDDWTEF
jgi:methyl-accepting chemotaxis protein